MDYYAADVAAEATETWEIIPSFTMPPVSPAGPFHLYGAMFQSGFLDLEHLVSNGAVAEFYLE